MNQIGKLHYITQDLEFKSHQQQVEDACKGGVDWVQLRMKDKTADERLKIATEVKEICKSFNATLIINDYVELAKEIQVEGVHIGKEDMAYESAREFLGNNFIIGRTTNTYHDVLSLKDSQVNYVGLGPYRFTNTKKNLSPILGVDGYNGVMKRCLIESVDIPIIAIGGIQLEDVEILKNTGIHGIAVSSIINLADEPSQIASEFMMNLRQWKN